MFDKILVVAAHADDEILGCGGFLSELMKHSPQHPEIAVVWCDDLEEMYRAGKCLMLEERHYTTCKESMNYILLFHEIKLTIITFLEEAIKRAKPDSIFYHFADNHQDHKVVNEAVKIACRRYKGSMFEYLVTAPAVGVKFNPNFYVNISNCMKAKLEALRKYENKLHKGKAPFNIESVKHWHRYLGMATGFEYAEAFKMVRGVAD